MFSGLRSDVTVFPILSGQPEWLLRFEFRMRGYCLGVMIYRKLAGNAADSKTIHHLLSDMADNVTDLL